MELDPIWLVVAGVVAVVVIGVVVALVVRRRRQRREQLQEHFGDEYERQVESRESRREAESELSQREQRFAEQDLRPLDTGDRQRIDEELREAAVRFVDDPRGALAKVDGLVTTVMHARGYEFSGHDEREQLLSVGFPDRVDAYRDGHAVAADEGGQRTTEDRRHAFLGLRDLVEALMDGREREPRTST